ncbi:MAG: acyloxyacyl hydrolase [Acidobacteria bacterium]|nr:acyloxyacyl hydrolase [Acidobacteriota bacterium]
MKVVPARAGVIFRDRKWELGAMAGYASSLSAPRGDNPGVSFSPILVSVGCPITDIHGTGSFQGDLEIVIEPALLAMTAPARSPAEGVSLLLRYNFVAKGPWVPFFDIGMGVLNWSIELPDVLVTKFNFTLQAGPGLRYFPATNLALVGQLRFHHISNGGRDRPNVGVNSVVALVGVSRFF